MSDKSPANFTYPSQNKTATSKFAVGKEKILPFFFFFFLWTRVCITEQTNHTLQ